jgi:DNA-binding response OmpR family regulator
MLPDGSGLELLRYLKLNKKNDGVIIISAKDLKSNMLTDWEENLHQQPAHSK